jgi:hypothetical protein
MPVSSDDVIPLVIGGVLELIGLVCIVHLIRRPDGGRWRKLGFGLLLLVPILGPLIYGGMYELPEAKEGDMWGSGAGMTGDVTGSPNHDGDGHGP